MVLLYLLGLWVVVAAAACAAGALSWHVLKTKYRRQLAEAEALWHLQHQQDSPGTVIENVSLGWLNLLLQSLWTPVLEKHVAGLTTELLHKVFAEVLAKGSHKAPWKYLDSIGVEELSFGLVPPTLQVASAKFEPSTSMLTLSMDVRFTSSSAQAVLVCRSKAVAMLAPVTVRLEVTHVKLRGRLRLGLVLGQEAPGIQGMYYSFTSPPHLDVGVRPLGLPLPSVVPGVDTALRGVLSKLISRRMVEPHRRYLDIHRIYLNKHIARVGGPGGLLKVMVLSASGLGSSVQQQQQPGANAGPESPDGLRSKGKGSSSKASGSSSAGAAKLSSYCQLRLGSIVLRTPIVHHSSSADAVWNWQFSLALPFELDAWPAPAAAGAAGVAGSRGSASPAAGGAAAARSSAGSRRSSAGGDSSDELSLVVYDAQTVGQPVLLGKTKVSLCPLQLQPNGPARLLVLPLHKASSGRATVQVSVQWLKSTKQLSPQLQQQRQQQQMLRMQQGQRVAVPPTAPKEQVQQPLSQLQPLDEHAGPTSPQPMLRSASAFAPASKLVSWQDKTQLRAKSAAAAAKKSFSKLVSSNSAADEEDATAEPPAHGSGSPAATSPAQSGRLMHGSGEQQDAGPWRSPVTTASDDATSSVTASAADSSEQREAPLRPAPARTQSHTGAPYLAEQDSMRGSAAAATSWLSAYGWRGLGSWIWPESPTLQPAAAAPSRQASSVRPHSPWPAEEDGQEDEEEQDADDRSGAHSPGSADGRSGTNPLALLSHVVAMQKELEQQRAQLEAVQQQLEHSRHSYDKLKQVCRQRGRAALLQGARFVLHKADGSTQHVLLYLTHAGSTRGGQPSRLGRPQQPDTGVVLMLAALPETRREARLAFKRLAAAPADGLAAAAAGAAAGVEGSAHSGSSAAASSSAGGASNAGDKPCLSAFGSVGAGLRLRLQRGTLLQMGYESGKFPRSVLQTLKVVPAGQLVGVVRGNTHFAPPTNGSSAGGVPSSTSSSSSSAAECFTLLVQEDSSGYVTAINLQLPPVGNGRCLDEWLLAVRDVIVAGVQPAIAASGVLAVGTAAAGTAAAVRAASAGGAAAAGTSQGGQPVGAAAAAAVGSSPTGDSRVGVGTQLEGASDWVLPAAASVTPKPWAGAASNGVGEHDDDDSSSDTDDTTDDS